MEQFIQVNLNLLNGFGVTLLIFSLTLLFSIPLGLLLSFGTMSRFKVLSAPLKTFIWVIRGTPLMLQVMVIFYGPSLFFGIILDRTIAALVAFVINYSCYFSEIYRSGIQSMEQGQYEAGKVLGLSKVQTFFHIILFQVIRKITPPMANEIITLVKDTSLVRVISVAEILFVAQNRYVSKGLIWPLFYTGVFYLLFVGLLTILFSKLEKKLSYYQL